MGGILGPGPLGRAEGFRAFGPEEGPWAWLDVEEVALDARPVVESPRRMLIDLSQEETILTILDLVGV
jgi:hypothetical protein